jgi:ketosteroid isomerase-like protein
MVDSIGVCATCTITKPAIHAGGHMKPLCRGLAFVAIASSLLTACSSTQQAVTPDHRATIDAIRRDTEAAENAGSVERMRVYFADDVVMMAPNMPTVVGAANTEQAMRQFFDMFTVQIAYTSIEIVLSGDWGFDRGTYMHTVTPKRGGTPLKETGKYLWLYRRTPQGAWKQARVIWNSSDPLPGSGTQ